MKSAVMNTAVKRNDAMNDDATHTKLARAALALAMLLGTQACGGTAEPIPTGPTPLPPAVQAIIDAECASCHADPPSFGAPMAVTTHEAMHAGAITDPARAVYELVGDRIHHATMPMPPGGRLNDTDLATLDAWIGAGAPAGEGSVVDAGTPPPNMVGPAYLPCEPSVEFRAFQPGGAPDAPYEVHAEGNLVNCFAFASPFAAGEQGTAFAPIIDDDRVLHHWIIFGSSSLPSGVSPGEAFECGAGGMTADSRFLTGWAPGGRNLVLPETQGRELPGPGEYIILQVHYWNVRGYTDVRDRSGVAACTTTTPREHLVGTSTLGSLDIAIDPRSRDTAVVGTCTPAITEPVTIVGSGPHMHTYGTRIQTEVLRGGREDSIEMLVSVPNWDFNQQTGSPAPAGALVIQPGDVLRTTCVYDNPTDRPVYFGERTEDEMCFNFVSAYPAGALTTERGRARRLCID